MNRNEIINKIAEITNIDAEEFSCLKSSIVRRIGALFTSDEVQDEYNDKLYLSIVYKYYVNIGNQEKANKYAQLLANTIIGDDFVLGREQQKV